MKPFVEHKKKRIAIPLLLVTNMFFAFFMLKKPFLKITKQYSTPNIQTLKNLVKTSKLNHIAIIPDGNRRWAQINGLNPSDGHKKCFLEKAPKIFENIWDLGIHTTSFWCYSSDNLKRGKQEVTQALEYINGMIQKILPIAQQRKIKIVHVGRKDRMPSYLLKTVQQAEQITASFNDHILNLCMDYDGRNEIVRTIKKIIQNTETISKKIIKNHLDTQKQPYPDPDLIIRPGKEKRLSGFMSWQTKHSEFYFDKHRYFPEFDAHILHKAVMYFAKKHRRFGH
ncbi:MAG: polyprenyl diphosphate synthase [bacterium]